jgi:hypothetical protein
MTTITTIELQAIRKSLDAALADVAAKHGLSKLAIGRITYDPRGTFSTKLEGTKAGGKSREACRYEEESKLTKGRWPALGAAFPWGAHTMTVTGCGKGGAIQVTGTDGKAYTIKRAQWERKYGSIFDNVISEFALPAGGAR